MGGDPELHHQYVLNEGVAPGRERERGGGKKGRYMRQGYFNSKGCREGEREKSGRRRRKEI